MSSISRFLDSLKGHRTTLMTGYSLTLVITTICVLAITGDPEDVNAMINGLPLIGTFVFLLAVSAQQDKYAKSIGERLINPKNDNGK